MSPLFEQVSKALSCRLCWRIAGAVFAAIFLVEAIILVPSYFNFKDDLIDRMEEAGKAALTATFRPLGHAPDLDLALAGRLTDGTGYVVGGRVYKDGKPVAAFGERPRMDRSALDGTGRLVEGDTRYEIYIPAEALGSPYGVLARLDATWIGPELTAFVLRIGGLVLLISVAVSTATMLIVGRSAMQPMLALRDHLGAAIEDPAAADRHSFLPRRRDDEWAEVADTVNRLLTRVATTYREELHLLSALADRATDAIAAIDPNGQYVYANSAFLRLTGCTTLAELQAANRPLVRLGDDDPPAPLSEKLGDGLPGREMIVEAADGRSLYCLAQVSLARDSGSEVIHSYVHLTDITALRTAQRRLEAQNAELERATRAKSEFLATVNHELRTPLTSLKGALRIALQIHGESLTPKVRSLLEMAERNGERLNWLVGQILDIEQSAAGRMKLDFVRTDLSEIARRAAADTEQFAREYNVQIRLAEPLPPAPLVGDPGRLDQVFANLISNAVKYSPEGGTVRVGVTSLAEGWLRGWVEDQGPGIPEDFQPRIFQPFARGDESDQRHRGGAGLGLSISKELVERHGGTLAFDTGPSHGTTFHFDLPGATVATCAPARVLAETQRPG